MTRVRKWLSSGFTLQAHFYWGELLALVLTVILVNIIWPGVPAWAFLLIGFAAGASQRIVRDVRGWIHRRRTT
jgi:hypothetical protein